MAEVDAKRFAEVMKQIQELESKHTAKAYKTKMAQLADIRVTVANLQDHYDKSVKSVEKEKADVDHMKKPSTRDVFSDQKSFDEKMSVEQEEYIEALSAMEVAKSNLEGVQGQQKQLEKETADLAKQSEALISLYAEQDAILGKIFNGEYGSDLENKLEAEFDLLQEKKERILVAKYKWTNGRLLLDHAVKQLGVAVEHWNASRGFITKKEYQKMYQLVTVARNNISAAYLNVTGAKRYLNNIKFPYCEDDEMVTLSEACKNVYVDMCTVDRHSHAGCVFTVTLKRAAALLQWFDQVINKTIAIDLEKAKKELAPVEKALKQERLKLIKEKLGSEADCLEQTQMDFDDTVIEDELIAVAEPDKCEDSQNTLGVDDTQVKAPTPLPLNKLAPLPSEEDLFGNIEQLKQQHEKEMAEFEKAQETNKARLEQGLQEKLAARRNRRSRAVQE